MKLLAGCLLLGLLAVSDDPSEVDFGTLSGFEYSEGMKLPKSVTRYDEKTVEVSGFMKRETPGDGEVEFFLLINAACGCEGTPKINEIIYCAMPDGETTSILPGAVTLTGKLYVGEEKEDGIVVGIYALDVDDIE